ncbi:TetR/AcrR family transcriptional regulator [Sphingomonas aracearum]|uniref:TetR/AcrR family transcriptional regulator n=1 Tax=Sphingomonas aracearum TaxID=2283317 RepID=A0A369W1V6_9SPHN|nr:TetR/AcrR family transcriptional regulator [Sphingomonas aracearum]RDE06041.1 TetR/AcrR family transcriptional regulator [Sphingomonas aracearum]
MQSIRKDVVRNRAELLATAEAVMADHGVLVGLSVIARAAGVGQGTLYRHFPDRQTLLLALIDRTLKRLEVFASAQQGVNGLFLFLRFCANHAREHAALADYRRVVDEGHQDMKAARDRFVAIVEPLLHRAVEAGLCRPDLTINDIEAVLCMFNALSPDASWAEAPSLDRVLELVTGGLQRR